jgi:hypothetical protein
MTARPLILVLLICLLHVSNEPVPAAHYLPSELSLEDPAANLTGAAMA